MQTAKEAREARRKRILERGSDRLAYITGDLSKHHSLKASPISPPQEASPVADTPHADGYRSSFESHDAKLENFDLSDHVKENDETFQEPLSGAQTLESPEFAAAPLETTPVLVSSSRFSVEPINRVPVLSSSTSSECSQQRRILGVKVGKKSSLTFVKNIVYSIEASESLRALAAAVVAVFVVSQMVLSCCGHPWGNALAVLLPRWPIGLVLFTDLTLIIGAYIIHSHSTSQKGLSSTESDGLNGKLDKISQALDVMGRFEHLLNIGLLCKKAAGAISLDFSIYVVTIVCGFSLSQNAFSCCKDF